MYDSQSRVLKYDLSVVGVTEWVFAEGAIPLHVAFQPGQPREQLYVWVEIPGYNQPVGDIERHRFQVVRTGIPFDVFKYAFLGTAVTSDRSFVVHVYHREPDS